VDASFDAKKYSGMGGLIVNMLGQQLSFFIVEVNKKTLTDDIMSKAQSTVIQELELMAVLASVRVWQSLVKACRVVLFTDSEALSGAFPQSWSANNDSDKMIEATFQVEEILMSRYGLNVCQVKATLQIYFEEK